MFHNEVTDRGNTGNTKEIALSRVEAESLKERDILCPTCGFRIQRVFSDATGHLSVKCQKCKNVHILSLLTSAESAGTDMAGITGDEDYK